MAWKPALTLSTALAGALATAVTAFGASPSQSPVVDPSVAAKHDADPVILTGLDFPQWSARSNQTAKLPLTDLQDCMGHVDPSRGSSPNDWLVGGQDCKHNNYATPEVDTGDSLGDGTPTKLLLGYRWDSKTKQFVQIPFQVDEVFTRYLDNDSSGFSIYSGQDQHTTYAYDREGFTFRKEDPNDPCHALSDQQAPTPDPVKGLDDNDELAFMASDAGPQAPADATLPAGIDGVRQVQVTDPQTGASSYAYVMKANPDRGPKPAFNADNGYVKYTRDDNADTFVYSQSSYDSYGNAPKGHFMWDGKCVGATPDQVKDNPKLCTQPNGDPVEKPGQVNQIKTPEHPNGDPNAFFECPQRHRPIDAATIQTDRYKFRYDGRWLLTALQISADGGNTFGPDLIDRWKARAFAQDPYSKTPCCGYEDEDKNWGGSSNLLGEKVGPVRAIRETWGADSGTNVIRRETFYRDGMRQKNFLRVHVIPPLDGIYAQWDFNAGKVDRYYNPRQPNGVKVDGRNDDMGNFDDPCNGIWDDDPSRNAFDQSYRDMYRQLQFCTPPCDPSGSGQCLPLNKYHLSMDETDPSFANLNASLDWSEVAGRQGTVVDRYQLDKVTDASAGGTPQSLFAMPYYRDDSCFDDGTGTDPGPRVLARSDNEPRTYTAPDGSTQKRQCWTPQDGDPAGSGEKFFQGDIATHGLHLLLIAESDNARQTVPVTEIVSEQRMVFLPGDPGNVGEQYGRSFEKPLVATTSDYSGTHPSGGGAPPQNPGGGGSNGGTPGASGGYQPAPQGGQQQVKGDRVSAHTAIPCLGNHLRMTKKSIGRLRLGDSSARTIKRVGRPTGVTNRTYNWCVNGGGRLVAVFSKNGRAQLIALRRGSRHKLTYRADRHLRKAQVRKLLRLV